MCDNQLQVVINITAENINLKQYICNELACDKEFNNEQALKKHLMQHYEKSSKIIYNYSCPVKTCRRHITKDYFLSRKHLIQHFYKVHNSEKYNCNNENCDKKFSTELLRNLHLKSCGKIFKCDFCDCTYNSNEALITHRRRKNHINPAVQKLEKKIKKKPENIQITKLIKSTSTSTSVGTNTVNFPTSPTIVASKSTLTDDFFINQPSSKVSKNSSTSTTDDFMKEESSNSRSSSSSQNKKANVNWSLTGSEFEEDSITLFDNDVKMEFYSTETQTDFSESLLNNNYTQTSFADFYDFEKFDCQTQTNWDEFNHPF